MLISGPLLSRILDRLFSLFAFDEKFADRLFGCGKPNELLVFLRNIQRRIRLKDNIFWDSLRDASRLNEWINGSARE